MEDRGTGAECNRTLCFVWTQDDPADLRSLNPSSALRHEAAWFSSSSLRATHSKSNLSLPVSRGNRLSLCFGSPSVFEDPAPTLLSFPLLLP